MTSPALTALTELEAKWRKKMAVADLMNYHLQALVYNECANELAQVRQILTPPPEPEHDAPAEWLKLLQQADIPSKERALSFLRIWANSYLANGHPWDVPQTMAGALRVAIGLLEEPDQSADVTRTTLRAQVEQFRKLYTDMHIQRDEARHQLREARAALRAYGQHTPECALRKPRTYRVGLEGYEGADGELQTRQARTLIDGPGDTCTCGFDSALQGSAGAAQQ